MSAVHHSHWEALGLVWARLALLAPVTFRRCSFNAVAFGGGFLLVMRRLLGEILRRESLLLSRFPRGLGAVLICT